MTDNDALVREKRLWKVICSLEAMSRNYAGGHMWDHLDGEMVCEAAALLRDFAALRSTPQARPLDLPAQDEVEAVAVAVAVAQSTPQPGAVVNQCLAELGDAEPLVVSKEDDGWAVRILSAWRLLHPAGDDALREENARLRAVVDALAVLMPIQVHDGRDYAEVFFADGATHSTQAMTRNPQHWRDLADAYDRAALTGRQG